MDTTGRLSSDCGPSCLLLSSLSFSGALCPTVACPQLQIYVSTLPQQNNSTFLRTYERVWGVFYVPDMDLSCLPQLEAK
ncbi:uncharacterized protein LOC143267022 isoform X2 [Peromyscus maniculatus bairdii]|uniref:uncharacterized protein LOC143267022 isoform X2 n=1 Tax=Peromyscus maniculatus bairdii TaxID=230844 RepID=UPI003FD53CEE